MFYGNAHASTAIQKYIDSASFGPLLLSGPKGVGKSILAQKVVKAALCVGDMTDTCQCQSCRQITANPDYIRVGIPEGKKVIGVEVVEDIVRKSSLLPLVSRRNVVLIDDMEKMTEAAQNKLLKTLEDNQKNLLVVGMANDDGILDTIESRMCKVVFQPLNGEDFKGFCHEKGLEPFEILYAATGGVPGVALTLDRETVELFKRISECIVSRPESMFNVLGLIKEKDKKSFFLTSIFTRQLLRFMEVVYLQMMKSELNISVGYSVLPAMRKKYYTVRQLHDSIMVINKNQKMMKKNISYNANDFFLMMMELVEIGKGGK